MLPPSLERSLDAYAARLRRRFGERLRMVRLFGSWARGEATPDSDIDVAVVIRDMTRDDWRDAVALAAEAELAGDEAMSPLVLSSDRFDALLAGERRLARDLLEEGVPL